MTPEQRPITGAEHGDRAATPTEALAQFYAAFNAASLDALANSWEQSDDIAMDNPVGGIVRGWAAVRQVSAKLVRRPRKALEAGTLGIRIGRVLGVGSKVKAWTST
jgi:hypothetical protein